MIRVTAPITRTLFAAAVAFGGFAVAGADEASAAVRCSAHALTAVGSIVPRTNSVEIRERAQNACRAALRVCSRRLDRQRVRTGFDFPYARCAIADRTRVAGHGGDFHHAKPKGAKKRKARFAPETRCVAKAFTRGGRELSKTRAAEVALGERRACAAAINRCEHKLDIKRWRTGRGLRRARCEVVRSVRLAGDVRF